MKLLSKIILLCALPTTMMFANSTKLIDYTVKKGDTLFSIARQHHTSIDALAALNQLSAEKILKPQMHLKVEPNTYFPLSRYNKNTQKVFTYTIQSGDILSSVAERYHTSVKDICQRNNMKQERVLHVGDTLAIAPNLSLPFVATTATPKKKQHVAHKTKRHKTIHYTVAKGDTLSTIAQRHQMPLETLLALNHLNKKSLLKVGQKLKAYPSKKHYASKKRVSHKRKYVAKKKQKTTQSYYVSTKGKKGFKLISLAKQKLGKRYVWGATGSNTFDCSGLTSYVCRKNGIHIPRRAIAQSRVGKRIAMKDLKVGDLVFFDTSKHRRGYVNHVGIYIGNGKFIHASSAKKRVVITSLNKPFYRQRFKWARRVTS